MKIVFIQMHVPDPRTNKRIAVAGRVGEVNVICVRRTTQDIWEPYYKEVIYDIMNLNLPTSRHMLKRVMKLKKFEKMALEKLDEIKPDIIYCGGLDTLMIVCKYKKRNRRCKVYFEVADLRECFIERTNSLKKKIKKFILERMEYRGFYYVDRLCLTSMKFYDVYYNKFFPEKKTIYVPNVPEISVFSDYKHKNNGDFTVGFIGGIRYLEQMKMLVDVTGQIGCRLLFAGAGGTNTDFQLISEYCRGKDWVDFTGKYDYNSQISSLYGSVDCVYAVYDAGNPNVRIALPNKLYESVYCELPIIVAQNTYLSEIVNKYEIGYAVDYQSSEELRCVLEKLMNQLEYQKISQNCCKAKSELVDNRWMDELEKSFRSIKDE